ncbi:hypothetical protein N7466_002145 [Penicillium verhagenii]|uniref:uncharacterized protein n=1 Tax=Penicillium verhagenii TaxID=1562060 RepID=UPI00254591D2|nr:uncharacterized protein N7466_002145 [Penicillium verhagenii]KAJ5939011.1 hypothetical protein N7466_002145 [Penicillium verhagenii]
MRLDKLAVEEITGHIPDAKPKPAEKSKSEQENDNKETKGEEEDDHEGEDEDPDAKPDGTSEEAKPTPTEEQSKEPQENQGTIKPTEDEMTPEFRKTSTLSITSWGHPVGLRASYPKSWIQKYKVEITKPCSWALSSEYNTPLPARLRSTGVQ